MRADDRVIRPLGDRINEVQAKKVLNSGTKYWPSDYKYWYISLCLQKKKPLGHNFHPFLKPITSNKFLHLIHSEQTSSQRERTDSTSPHSCNNSVQSRTTKYFVQANLSAGRLKFHILSSNVLIHSACGLLLYLTRCHSSIFIPLVPLSDSDNEFPSVLTVQVCRTLFLHHLHAATERERDTISVNIPSSQQQQRAERQKSVDLCLPFMSVYSAF